MSLIPLKNVFDIPSNMVALLTHRGAYVETLQPGRKIVWGSHYKVTYYDTRLQPVALQPQEMTTQEGITVKATAVGLFRIIDAQKADSSTSDYSGALYTIIQLALRDLISGVETESLLSKSLSFSPTLLEKVQDKVKNLGLEVTELVVRDIILPTEIRNAFSAAWRAKKLSIAELEAARGKAAAARALANVAKLYDSNPNMLKSRYLDVIEKAAESMGNTFVLGLPEQDLLSINS